MIEFRSHSFGSFDAKRHVGPSQWPHHDLLFVHRGDVALIFSSIKKEILLRSGQGVLIWPNTHIRGWAVSRSAHASVQHFLVRAETAEPFSTLSKQCDGISCQSSAPSRQLELDVRRSIDLAAQDWRQSEWGPMRRALLALILAEGGFLQASSLPDQRRRIDTDALEKWLRGNLDARPGVTELASLAGLSPGRFRAVFRAEHGRTAGEFIFGVRDGEARRLLVESREPIKKIAAAVGYSDVVAFQHAFKRRAGLPPAAYRRIHWIHG